MKLYEHKKIECGFIILCQTCNKGQVKTTIDSLRHNYPSSRFVCAVSAVCHKEEADTIARLGKICLGGESLTSLINAGMREAPCPEWNILVNAGSWIPHLLDHRYGYFIQDGKDILFPLADRQMNFVDATMNGLMMRKEAFEDIGPFDDHNPLEISKLLWAMDAAEKGYRFKAILGTKVC